MCRPHLCFVPLCQPRASRPAFEPRLGLSWTFGLEVMWSKWILAWPWMCVLTSTLSATYVAPSWLSTIGALVGHWHAGILTHHRGYRKFHELQKYIPFRIYNGTIHLDSACGGSSRAAPAFQLRGRA